MAIDIKPKILLLVEYLYIYSAIELKIPSRHVGVTTCKTQQVLLKLPVEKVDLMVWLGGGRRNLIQLKPSTGHIFFRSED